MTLLKRIENSAYLNALLALHPEFLPFAKAQKRVGEAELQAQIDCLGEDDSLDPDQTSERSVQLRIVKQKFSLLWSIAELTDSVSFGRLGEIQSVFADKSIQAALDIAWHSKQIAKLFVKAEETKPEEAGIFILGLGKLGGNDLNFSSDIDLIAFFDKQKLDIAPMHGAAYAVSACSEATQQYFV